MALPNYAKMFPTAPRGVVPSGVSPSAWALDQSQANQAAMGQSRDEWIRGNIAGGTPAFLLSLMGPNSGLPPDIVSSAQGRWDTLYPKGPELSGERGNLPYLQQRAYDAMIRNERAAAGLNMQGQIPTPQIGGIGGAGEVFVPLSAQGNIQGYQNQYNEPTIGNMGGTSPYPAASPTTSTTPTTPTTPTPAPAWYNPESDPSGSMWDAFQKSLNQATMPAEFRATWGGG